MSDPTGNVEVVWVRDNVFFYWYPAKRLEQDELTEDMKKRLDDANPNKKKKKDYVVEFSNGDFKIVGKGDKVRPFGDKKETVKMMRESIALIKKYPIENNPKQVEELKEWLEKYGGAVIRFEKLVNPSSDVSWILDVIKETSPPEFSLGNVAATSTQTGAGEVVGGEDSELGMEVIRTINESKPVFVEEKSESTLAFSKFDVSPLTPSSFNQRNRNRPVFSRTVRQMYISAHMKHCQGSNNSGKSRLGKRRSVKKKKSKKGMTICQNADTEHNVVMAKLRSADTAIVDEVEVDKKEDATEAGLEDKATADQENSFELHEGVELEDKTGGKLYAKQFKVDNQGRAKASVPPPTPPPSSEQQSKVPNQPQEAADDPKNTEKEPAFVVTRGVHLVPTENEDKSISFGVFSLENASDYDPEFQERYDLDPDEAILVMQKVDPAVPGERMPLMNPDEMEAAILDRDVNDPNEIVSVFAERPTSSDSAKCQNDAAGRQKNREPETIGDLAAGIGDGEGETYVYLVNQEGVYTNLCNVDTKDVPLEFIMKILEAVNG